MVNCMAVHGATEVEHCGRRFDEGREQWELGGGQLGLCMVRECNYCSNRPNRYRESRCYLIGPSDHTFRYSLGLEDTQMEMLIISFRKPDYHLTSSVQELWANTELYSNYIDHLEFCDLVTLTFLLFLPVLSVLLLLDLFVYLRLIIGTLFLCISAHLTVLPLSNPVLNIIFLLLPITSSHSHASASDSTFDYRRYINISLTLTYP